MATVPVQHLFRIGGFPRMTCGATGEFDAGLAGFLVDAEAPDPEGLADAGEGKEAVQLGGRPNGAPFLAAVVIYRKSPHIRDRTESSELQCNALSPRRFQP